MSMYRVTHLLANLGWVDFDLGNFDVPPSCTAVQQVLLISHRHRQNQAEGGTAKISLPNPGSPGDVSPCMSKTVKRALGTGNI